MVNCGQEWSKIAFFRGRIRTKSTNVEKSDKNGLKYSQIVSPFNLSHQVHE